MKKYIIILLVVLSSCGITYDIPEKECCKTTYCQTQYYPKYNWFYWSRPQNNYVIIKPNKPNKPHYNKPNNRPNNKPNNRPNRGHRK